MFDLKRISIPKIILLIGLFQIAAYWFAGSIACQEGVLAVPQPDTPLYYQAARRIVEGHPFSYSEGSAVCTGTTTVLYPFILAIPYAMGMTGDLMLIAGFILNAIFYLMFLLGWCVAIKHWCDRDDVRLLASLLIALMGHFSFVTFSQSDIGFLLAFTALFASAIAGQKRILSAILLIIGPWVRPEGMIIVIAYAMVALFGPLFVKQEKKDVFARCLISVIGVLSVFAVFLFNYILTGHFQFSSVAGKGYFVVLPFERAAFNTIGDLMSIFKAVFLGVSAGMPRDVLTIPVLGGVLLCLGIGTFCWRRANAFGLSVMVLAAFGGILNVAQSGWQGTNMDRYLVWMMPIWIVLVAQGTIAVVDRIPKTISLMPVAAVVFFTLVGTISGPVMFCMASKSEDCSRYYGKACEEVMPKGASYGSLGACAMLYYCSPRRCAHLTGIYSSEFSPKNYMDNLERLRNEPGTRFDYWITGPTTIAVLGEECAKHLGEVVLPGPGSETLIKADWTMFEPRKETEHDGRKLVAKLDLGYERDEKAADYHIITRWGYEVFEPFAQYGMLNGRAVFDIGRVVLGGDEMTVPLEPGKDVTVVMRIWPKHSVYRSTGVSNTRIDCTIENPFMMNISIDGKVVNQAKISYPQGEEFSEVSFVIPGSVITGFPCRLGLLGDHIAFGYWFYQ